MALLFVDPCDHYGPRDGNTGLYRHKMMGGGARRASSTIAATSGKFGYGAKVTSSTTYDATYFAWAGIAQADTLRGHFHFRNESSTGTGAYIFIISTALEWDSSGTESWGLYFVPSTGALTIYDWANGGAGQQAVKTLNPNQWYTFEWEWVIDNSGSGSMKIWVDNVLEYSQTSDDWYTSDPGAFAMSGPSSGAFWFDDIILWDDSGSEFTGQKGPMRIHTDLPTGDSGTDMDFSLSGGSNGYELVDQALDASVNEADYVYSATATDRALFTFPSSLPSTPSAIHAVGMFSACRKDGPLDRSYANKIKSGATYDDGDQTFYLPMLADARYINDWWALDPNTAGAWSEANALAAELGIEVKT